jgi:exodeoxyribonuclease-3
VVTSPSAARQRARAERRAIALSARAEMSPRSPAPDRFRVATWNVNSLRARSSGLGEFLERVRPDVVCLQETKATSLAGEPAEVLDRHGYVVEHVGSGAYNGVAIASLHPLDAVRRSGGFGNDDLDREPRLITAVLREPMELRVATVYVPHGREVGHWHYEYKLRFLEGLALLVDEWVASGSLLLAGDVNVAATDSDIFHPDAFVGLTHVTAAERDAWARVLAAGLVDVDVLRWGRDARRFTWWKHGLNYSRNLGMRLDVIATDRSFAERLDTTWIDHLGRGGERASDHAVLIADFDLGRG